MPGENKLTLPLGGRPMLARAVESIVQSGLSRIVVVTGHQEERVRQVLAGYPVEFVHNPEFERGLGSTLGAGVETLAEDSDGILVCLGDMPRVASEDIRALVERFEQERGALICAPFWQERRGHPVLWPRRFFQALASLEGDRGGRPLLEKATEGLARVEASSEGVLLDVDTPEALAVLGAWANEKPGRGRAD